jgi:hypothetical protein
MRQTSDWNDGPLQALHQLRISYGELPACAAEDNKDALDCVDIAHLVIGPLDLSSAMTQPTLASDFRAYPAMLIPLSQPRHRPKLGLLGGAGKIAS